LKHFVERAIFLEAVVDALLLALVAQSLQRLANRERPFPSAAISGFPELVANKAGHDLP